MSVAPLRGGWFRANVDALDYGRHRILPATMPPPNLSLLSPIFCCQWPMEFALRLCRFVSTTVMLSFSFSSFVVPFILSV